MGHPAARRKRSDDRSHDIATDEGDCLDERAVLDRLEHDSSSEQSTHGATGVVMGVIIGGALWAVVLTAIAVFLFL